VWPLLFTLGNLIAGFAAIHYAYKGADWHGPWGWSGLTMAGALIFLGMFLDSIDGYVARLTRSVTELGAALDSLSDLVTCGVAPAVMVLSLVASYLGSDGQLTILGPDADLPWGKVVWGIAAVYVCCTALRLARFTVETQPQKGPNDHMAFHGMPSPGAAGLIASIILLHQHVLASGGDTLWIEIIYSQNFWMFQEHGAFERTLKPKIPIACRFILWIEKSVIVVKASFPHWIVVG
jgi:CDP-diacylglycerol--serine O-phosphatidyltransferase